MIPMKKIYLLFAFGALALLLDAQTAIPEGPLTWVNCKVKNTSASTDTLAGQPWPVLQTKVIAHFNTVQKCYGKNPRKSKQDAKKCTFLISHGYDPSGELLTHFKSCIQHSLEHPQALDDLAILGASIAATPFLASLFVHTEGAAPVIFSGAETKGHHFTLFLEGHFYRVRVLQADMDRPLTRLWWDVLRIRHQDRLNYLADPIRDPEELRYRLPSL